MGILGIKGNSSGKKYFVNYLNSYNISATSFALYFGHV